MPVGVILYSTIPSLIALPRCLTTQSSRASRLPTRSLPRARMVFAVADDGYTVRVRPQIVVEVDYNEIQKSPTYPSGLALRFARIARVRDDKGPGQATTLAELRRLYDGQFLRKGRAG